MSELTCRRCCISNPQEFDISCLIVDTSLVSCITQIYKSVLSRRTNCHSSKKTREKKTAHLTQIEDSCKQCGDGKESAGFVIILYPGKCPAQEI